MYIKTESHGRVPSGFHTPFAGICSLGDYLFMTDEFCSFSRSVANDREMRASTIRAYDLSKFPEGESEENTKYLMILLGDCEDETSVVEIKISPEGSRISIGKYELSDEHFGNFAYYIARGGFYKWQDPVPKFASVTMEGIKNSEHPLYMDIKKKLDELGIS